MKRRQQKERDHFEKDIQLHLHITCILFKGNRVNSQRAQKKGGERGHKKEPTIIPEIGDETIASPWYHAATSHLPSHHSRRATTSARRSARSHSLA
jgi:hypothetical protein